MKNEARNHSGIDKGDLEKAKAHSLEEITDYTARAISSRVVLNKNTGQVICFAFDSGQATAETLIPFDQLIHVIEGTAEVMVNNATTMLGAGNLMIIPAHQRHTLRAVERFKIILTVIKSGYED